MKKIFLATLIAFGIFLIYSPCFVSAFCWAPPPGVVPIPPPPAGSTACLTNEVCTALGCIPTQQNPLVVWILARAMSLGGGIAFLLMISGAIQLLTSSGNPEGIKKGGETITSALMGLLFIILSLFLLNLIGVKIFQIPGF